MIPTSPESSQDRFVSYELDVNDSVLSQAHFDAKTSHHWVVANTAGNAAMRWFI